MKDERRSKEQRERESAYLAALEVRPDDPLLRSLIPAVAGALPLPDGLVRSVEHREQPGTQSRSRPKALREALTRKTPDEVNTLAANLLHTLLIHLHETPTVATMWQHLGRIVLDTLEYPSSDDRLFYVIGARALAFLTRVHPDLVTSYSGWQAKQGKPRRDVMHLTVARKYKQRVREMTRRYLRAPSLWCVAPPLDWQNEKDGGFHLAALRQEYPLLKGKHLASDARVSADTLSAVNALQRTAWQINRALLDAVSRLPDKVLRRIVANGADSKDFRRRLNIAQELRDIQALYNVIQLDYRGRFYPMVGTSLKVQGDDLALALLRFAPSDAPVNPKLRQRAEVALKLAATDHYGPLPRDLRPQPHGAQFNSLVATRLAWVRQHEAQILATAAEPAANAEFWMRAKKPWQFLAWCIEWAEQGRECAEQSTLPVRADCTTSVYQHLACLLRSQGLAEWTNLTRASSRVDHSPADFYAEVAKRLREWLTQESEQPSEHWEAQEREVLKYLAAVPAQVFTRDLIKSPAMTWAYGAGDRTLGKRFQEGFRKVLDGRTPWVGPVLVQGLEAVLKKVVPEVPDVRDWLKTVASDRKKPIEWSVPVIGFPAWMRRSYTHKKKDQLTGEINGEPVRLNVRLGRQFSSSKHARSFMPNYIHSLDAAVVTLAIGQLATDDEVRQLGATHDAFTTTAAHMDRLQTAVREAMQRLYTTGPTPVLQDLTAQLNAAGLPDVSAPPRLGTFDLEELSGSLMLHS